MVSLNTKQSKEKEGFPLEVGITHNGEDVFLLEDFDYFLLEEALHEDVVALGLPAPLRGARPDEEIDGGGVGGTARGLTVLGRGGTDSFGSSWLVVPARICTTKKSGQRNEK